MSFTGQAISALNGDFAQEDSRVRSQESGFRSQKTESGTGRSAFSYQPSALNLLRPRIPLSSLPLGYYVLPSAFCLLPSAFCLVPAVPHTFSRAISKSRMMSCQSSRPREIRMPSGCMPKARFCSSGSAECVIEKGCSIRVLICPRLTASVME